MPLQRVAWSALTCFRVPRCKSAQPDLHGEIPACPWPKLPQIKYGLCGLRMSKCSANFQKDVIFQQTYWNCSYQNCFVHGGFLRQPANSPLLHSEHFKMPMDFSACSWIFRCELLCVLHDNWIGLVLATSQVIHDPWEPPLKPGRNPCCLWNLERNNVPSRSPEGL